MTRPIQGRLLAALLFSSLLITACGSNSEAPPAATESNTGNTTPAAAETNTEAVAVVNGKNITMADLTFFLRSKQNASPSEALDPSQVLEEMVSRELLVAEALKAGVDQRDDVKKMLEIQKNSMLVNALIEQKLATLDLGEAVLKKEYDEQIKELDLKEFKARHILLKTEDEAKAVIEQLKGGADFVALATEKSAGPTGPNGGDLGWFQADSMVESFASAIKSMEKGKYSEAPVKSEFGWHVILLEDMREQAPPAFDASRGQLETIVANKAIEQFLSDLRATAKIELKGQAASDKLVTEPQAETEAAPANAPASAE